MQIVAVNGLRRSFFSLLTPLSKPDCFGSFLFELLCEWFRWTKVTRTVIELIPIMVINNLRQPSMDIQEDQSGAGIYLAVNANSPSPLPSITPG
jgi:hypothetical protein